MRWARHWGATLEPSKDTADRRASAYSFCISWRQARESRALPARDQPARALGRPQGPFVTRRVHRISQHRRPFPACFCRSRTTRRTCSPPAPPTSRTESLPPQESVLSQPQCAARRALWEKAPCAPSTFRAAPACRRARSLAQHARAAPAAARLRPPLRAAPSCRRPFPQQVALQKRLGQITSQATFQNLELRRSHIFI